MRLIRYGPPGTEKPGILQQDGTRSDVSALGEDYDAAFFASGGLQRLQRWLDTHPDLPAITDSERWGAPIGLPSKMVCVGLNYADHAHESGVQPPREPVLFFKATSAICGPYDDLLLPGEKTDWEVELAVVIGRPAARISTQNAMQYVAGYLLHNDYSERNFQFKRGGQWVKGKSCDTFAPLGPFMATADEIADPHNLRLWLRVNGMLMQNSNTKHFIFDIPYLIHYISHFMTLLPGDIITTGTPAGVGHACTPPRYLQPGDVVEPGIEGLGSSRQVARNLPTL